MPSHGAKTRLHHRGRYHLGNLPTQVFESREALLAVLVRDFMVPKMKNAERRTAFAASTGATDSDLTEEVIADWGLDMSFDYRSSHMVRYEYARAHLKAAFAAYRVEVASRLSLEWDDEDANRSLEQGLHDVAEETKRRIIAHHKLGIVTSKTARAERLVFTDTIH